MIVNLNDKIVCLQISMRSFRRKANDKELAAETAKAHGVEEDSKADYDFLKNLFPDKAIKIVGLTRNPMAAVASLRQNLKSYIKDPLSLMQTGISEFAVTMENYEKAMARKVETDAAIAEQVEIIKEKYAAIVAASRMILVGTWKESDFPSLEKTLDSCHYSIITKPFPVGNHLPQWIEEEVRKQTDAEHASSVENAIVNGMVQTIQLVSEVAALWSKPNGKVFESTLEKLMDKINSLQSNNSVVGNAVVSDMVASAKAAISGVNIDKLRSDVAFRSETASKLSGVATTGDSVLQVFYGRRALAVDTGE